MKKTACMLLALLLAFSASSAALAASVSYQDGKVTVIQQDGTYMILIDGVNTGKWVGKGMPSNTFDYPLEEGTEHQLVLLSLAGDGNIGAMESFWAGPTPEPTPEPTLAPTAAPTEAPSAVPTAEPTAEPSAKPAAEASEEPAVTPEPEPTAEPTPAVKGPVRIESASYEDHVLSLVISGLRGYAEIWIDSKNTGFIVKENGPFSLNRTLPAGNHTVSLYAPAYNEVDTAAFYARFSPDPELSNIAALGTLLKTGEGAEIAYRLAYTSDGNGAVMVLTAGDGAENGLNLYLSESLLDKLKSSGVSYVRLVSGGAELEIQLDMINPSLFATEKAIWYYVFSISPMPDGSYRVNVAAQTSVTDLMNAGYYSGVTLIRDGEAYPVILNGFY